VKSTIIYLLLTGKSKGINGLSTLFHILSFNLKSKMPLREIAKAYNNDGCQRFSYGWKDVKPLYKKLDKNIVQQHADHHKCKIPCKLHSSPQRRPCKYNIPHQIKACRKSYHERDYKRCYIRAYAYDRSMYNLLFQDEIVGNEINNNIKQRITTSACNISKGLPVNDPVERTVKKIKQANNKKL
jgi:hypothetical protein